MPRFAYRFTEYHQEEWKELTTAFSDPRDVAEEACERAFDEWLWESASSAPFKVEVRSPDGSVEAFSVEMESVPEFHAYPAEAPR